MTISYRILNMNGNAVAECGGQIYGLEDLCDAIWLTNKEIRGGLPKRERVQAQNQIAHYEAMLDALRRAGG
jgi:hypothetical protein